MIDDRVRDHRGDHQRERPAVTRTHETSQEAPALLSSLRRRREGGRAEVRDPITPEPPSTRRVNYLFPLAERARFLTDFARRLHLAGVSAARLEGAVQSTAKSIGVDCEIWSSPTGILLSIGDPAQPNSQQTRVLRLDPAEPNLSDLVALDEIAERVIAGRVGVVEASTQLRALDRPPDAGQRAWTVVAFGLAAAAVAGLLRTSWTDVTAAGALGMIIGAIAVASRKRPHLAAASEAIAAMVATVLAAGFAHFVAPLSVQTVVIAALIVLMPGLSLTTAVTELASGQLVTGTARFAGAMVVLFKLTFGSIAGAQIVSALGWTPRMAPALSLPAAIEVVATLAAAFSFAILFRAARRDVPIVMASLPLLDSGEASGLLFYVMPFVEGETLRTRLTRETQLPVEDAVRIAPEVADALVFAHGGGTHRGDAMSITRLIES